MLRLFNRSQKVQSDNPRPYCVPGNAHKHKKCRTEPSRNWRSSKAKVLQSLVVYLYVFMDGTRDKGWMGSTLMWMSQLVPVTLSSFLC